MATDYDYFGGAEASRGWAPEYIDRLSIADGDQSWKFARAWTLGEVITALLQAGLRLERVTEREIERHSQIAAAAFDERMREVREEAATRLARELDRAVEHMSREELTRRLDSLS